MAKKASKLDQLRLLAAERALTRIDEIAAISLKQALQPISDSHFRKIVRDSGLALSPLVEGVRQDSLHDLERTLLAMLDELELGEKQARREVIQSRDHARLVQRRHPSPEREEAILWMTVWLENPPVFRTWLAARKSIAIRPTRP